MKMLLICIWALLARYPTYCCKIYRNNSISFSYRGSKSLMCTGSNTRTSVNFEKNSESISAAILHINTTKYFDSKRYLWQVFEYSGRYLFTLSNTKLRHQKRAHNYIHSTTLSIWLYIRIKEKNPLTTKTTIKATNVSVESGTTRNNFSINSPLAAEQVSS